MIFILINPIKLINFSNLLSHIKNIKLRVNHLGMSSDAFSVQ